MQDPKSGIQGLQDPKPGIHESAGSKTLDPGSPGSKTPGSRICRIKKNPGTRDQGTAGSKIWEPGIQDLQDRKSGSILLTLVQLGQFLLTPGQTGQSSAHPRKSEVLMLKSEAGSLKSEIWNLESGDLQCEVLSLKYEISEV